MSILGSNCQFSIDGILFVFYKAKKVKFTIKKKRDMDDNFSPKVRDVITFSKEEALRLGHDFIGTEHLLLGLIRKGDGKAIEILKKSPFN